MKAEIKGITGKDGRQRLYALIDDGSEQLKISLTDLSKLNTFMNQEVSSVKDFLLLSEKIHHTMNKIIKDNDNTESQVTDPFYFKSKDNIYPKWANDLDGKIVWLNNEHEVRQFLDYKKRKKEEKIEDDNKKREDEKDSCSGAFIRDESGKLIPCNILQHATLPLEGVNMKDICSSLNPDYKWMIACFKGTKHGFRRVIVPSIDLSIYPYSRKFDGYIIDHVENKARGYVIDQKALEELGWKGCKPPKQYDIEPDETFFDKDSEIHKFYIQMSFNDLLAKESSSVVEQSPVDVNEENDISKLSFRYSAPVILKDILVRNKTNIHDEFTYECDDRKLFKELVLFFRDNYDEMVKLIDSFKSVSFKFFILNYLDESKEITYSFSETDDLNKDRAMSELTDHGLVYMSKNGSLKMKFRDKESKKYNYLIYSDVREYDENEYNPKQYMYDVEDEQSFIKEMREIIRDNREERYYNRYLHTDIFKQMKALFKAYMHELWVMMNKHSTSSIVYTICSENYAYKTNYLTIINLEQSEFDVNDKVCMVYFDVDGFLKYKYNDFNTGKQRVETINVLSDNK